MIGTSVIKELKNEKIWFDSVQKPDKEMFWNIYELMVHELLIIRPKWFNIDRNCFHANVAM